MIPTVSSFKADSRDLCGHVIFLVERKFSVEESLSRISTQINKDSWKISQCIQK